MVAALTPPDIETSLTDENVTVVDFRKEVDLVGITALTIQHHVPTRSLIRSELGELKVILGGIHTSVLPEEASQHADTVVIGA